MKKYWYFLTGASSDFTLESRIFHFFCIVAIIALSISFPINVILGLHTIAWFVLAALILQSSFYYLSRFKHWTRAGLFLSIVSIYILFIFNYFFDSGVNGPTLLFLLTIFFLVISISKPKEYILYAGFNLILVLSLTLIEYFHPESIIDSGLSVKYHLVNINISYIICIAIILLGLRYIKKNYYLNLEKLESKAADLEQNNETKNKLFSIISHDLRAPIASVQSYLEILSHLDNEKENWQEIKGDLIELTQSTDNMLSNILMWAKSQMEGISINKSLINLAESLSPVIKVFQSVANMKQITLKYTIDPALKVLADKNMLELVIRNILSNAVKFTNQGGTINLEVNSEYPNYVIKISDNGTGMSEEVKNSIFSIKAESSYGTNNERGIGLGLSLSKEFIELQGGKIWFESETGKGSIFYIAIPIN